MLNVLYVDDEVINLDLLEMTFRREFKVHKSLSASFALDFLKENNIDVIITDLKMPEMDGIQFIKEVKKQYPKMNCILLTGYYEAQFLEDPAMQELLFKYVLKPFKKDEMLAIINEAAKEQ